MTSSSPESEAPGGAVEGAWRSAAAAAGVLGLLVLLAWGDSLRNGFAWDDIGLIVDNPNLGRYSLAELFANSLWSQAGVDSLRVYYRPIVAIWFSTLCAIFGKSPLAFHLAGLLVHSACVVLVYALGRKLLRGRSAAPLCAAALFAVHPIHGEVCGRVASGEQLLGLMMLLSVYCVVRGRWVLAYLAFAVALLTKESAVMLPLALAPLVVPRMGWRRSLLRLIPCLLLVAGYLVLRARFTDTVLGEGIGSPPMGRLAAMLGVAGDYLRILVLPLDVRPFRPARAPALDLQTVAGLLALLAYGWLLLRTKAPATRFLLLAPLALLLPVIWRVNTFPVGGSRVYLAERFLYVPAGLFLLGLASAAEGALLGASPRARKAALAAVGLTLLAFTCQSVFAARVWRDNVSVHTRIAQDAPRCVEAHRVLGDLARQRGDYQAALEHWERAAALAPEHADTQNSLGNVYSMRGDRARALSHYRLALAADPGHVEALYNCAQTLEAVGRVREARACYLRFLDVAPPEYGQQVRAVRAKLGLR